VEQSGNYMGSDSVLSGNSKVLQEGCEIINECPSYDKVLCVAMLAKHFLNSNTMTAQGKNQKRVR